MRAVIILLTILASGWVPAQDQALERFASTITRDELSEHVHRLASADFEGRFTGSDGQKLAADYIREAFEKDGLERPVSGQFNGYYQAFVLEKCHWEEQSLASGGVDFEAGKDFVFLTDPMDTEGSYPLVFAGFGIDDSLYSDYGGLDVTGKVLLVFSGEPQDRDGHYLISGRDEPSRKAYYFSKSAEAEEKGAKGLIVIAREEDDFRKYMKNSGDYTTRADITYPSDAGAGGFFTIYTHLPTAAALANTGTAELRKALEEMSAGQVNASGRFTGQVEVRSRKRCTTLETENLIGVVEGTDLKDEAVVVVAHYDHLGVRDGEIYYGADDNASGTAAVMEIAGAFAAAAEEGLRPRRSVIFLAVSAEEIGLYGSRYYTENPLIPMDMTYACVNIDMIGRASNKLKSDPDYVSGYAYLSEGILAVARRNNGIFAPGLADRMEYRERLRGGSDHYHFSRNGVPSLFYFAGIHNDYHEPGDTPDKILYDRMEQIVRAIFGTTWDLANSNEKMKVED